MNTHRLQVRTLLQGRALLQAATTAVLVTAAVGCSAETTAPEPSTTTAATVIPAPSTGGSSASSAPAVSTPAASTPVATAPAMPTGAPGAPRGLPTTLVNTTLVNTASVDSVAEAFVVTTFAYDSALDVSEFDAQVRSAVYADAPFATELTTPLARTGSATFTELAAHQGFTTVALVPNVDDGQPADDLRSAARSYDVTVTGQGSGDGWTAVVGEDTIYVSLVRTGASAPWQVTSVSFGLGQ